LFVRVQYYDETPGEVKPYQLDKLISLGKIKKFFRSGSWVIVGRDKTRKADISFHGTEKRKPITIRLL